MAGEDQNSAADQKGEAGSGHEAPEQQPKQPAAQPKVPAKKKPSVQIQEPPSHYQRGYSMGYTIVKVEEKHGPLHKAIPCMPISIAIICCIFNILIPGLGTLISSFTVFCCGSTRIPKPLQAFALNLVSALLQMLTFIIIVGWIWSILWGMTFVQLALSGDPSSFTESLGSKRVRIQSQVSL